MVSTGGEINECRDSQRRDFKKMLEIHLCLKGQMHQCKESVLGRMKNNGDAKEAEIE